MRISISALTFLAVVVASASAQTGLGTPAAKPETGSAASLIQEAKAGYEQEKKFILAAADKMPEENYAFKPTPEIRTYGELFSHITEAQNNACAILAGQTPPPRPPRPAPGAPAAPLPAKAEVVAALKASFDTCDSALTTLTPGSAFDIVGAGFMHGTKIGLVEKNVAHDNEMYGTISVYLRLKGIVPPSTAARTM